MSRNISMVTEDLVKKHKAEQDLVRSRLYTLEKEREELLRRDSELSGILAALDHVRKAVGEEKESDKGA